MDIYTHLLPEVSEQCVLALDKYVQLQMGHASCQITMDRYSHLMPETNENAINAMDNLFLNRETNQLKTATN